MNYTNFSLVSLRVASLRELLQQTHGSLTTAHCSLASPSFSE